MDEIEYYRDILQCFVPSCKKHRRDFPNSTYLSIPKSLQATWCQTLEMNCPKRNLYVCSEHINIEEDCYKTKSGKLRLKNTASLILTKTYEIEILNDENSLTTYPLENTIDTTSKECLQHGSIQNTKLEETTTQPGASGNNSYETTSYSDQESLDSNASETEHEVPFNNQLLDRCRFCAAFSKDCIKVTDEDSPYLTRNKTTLTLNYLSVEVDFNDALTKTVCRACDSKLLVMFDFLKQVKEAQDSLINVRDYVKEDQEEDIGNLTVKTECESPTPEDNDDIIDSKDGILDSLTVSETVFIKPISKYKRKSVEDTKTQKKPKVTKDVEIKSEESELINMKEETAEFDANEAELSEFNDTKTVTESSELELAKRALVNEFAEFDAYEAEISEFNDNKTVTESSELELAKRALINEFS